MVAAAAFAFASPATADAPGPQTQTAVWRVLNEYTVAMPFLQGSNTSYPIALSVMNYVNGRVSSANYAYLLAHGNPTGSDVEDILARQAGICQGAQLAFKQIGDQIGLRSRYVYVWYSRGTGPVGGHATIEVFYGAGWHMFDPTWGTFYRKPGDPPDAVLGIVDVLNLTDDQRAAYEQTNDGLLWRQVVQHEGAGAVDGAGLGFWTMDHVRVEANAYGGPELYRRG